MQQPTPSDLPNYKHPELVRLEECLQLLHDTYNGLPNKSAYLPKAEREPNTAYKRRLERSFFNNKIRPIIDSNAGLLTAFDVSGLPASLELAEGNVDGKGTGLKAWVAAANVAGLRDDAVYVLTQLDPSDTPRTLADDLERPRLPRWALIDRRNILNWRLSYDDGATTLEQVTILTHADVKDGLYGVKSELRYNVLRRVPGGVENAVYSLGEKNELFLVQEPQVLPISRIPLRPWPNNPDFFPKGKPPFAKAAELNIKLFLQESSLENIQYRVNAPTFWRRSSLEFNQRPPFIVGENYVIELMAGDAGVGADDVGVLEIDGAGIAALAAAIEQTKQDIQAEATGFVSGTPVSRTATEAYLSSAQMAATLNGWARRMSAALQGCIDDWCMFTKEDASTFELQIDHSILEQPLDAQEMQSLLGLWQAAAIDHRTLLELLRMGRQLPPSADIDEILERVAQEFSRDTQTPEASNAVLEPAAPAEG